MVYVVEQVYYVEDQFRCTTVVRVFATPEGADAWVAKTRSEEEAMRAAYARSRALRAEVTARIPFEFGEKCPTYDQWSWWLPASAGAGVLRDAREAVKAAISAYHERFSEAREGHASLVGAAMEAAWLAEGQKIPLKDVQSNSSNDPTEYTVTPMEVED